MDNTVEQPKEAQHPNLAQVITGILQESGVPNPAAWAIGLHEDGMHHESTKIQMFQCARQWALILSEYTGDSRFARYCLNSAGSVKAWLESFRMLVVPMYLEMLGTPAVQPSETTEANPA